MIFYITIKVWCCKVRVFLIFIFLFFGLCKTIKPNHYFNPATLKSFKLCKSIFLQTSSKLLLGPDRQVLVTSGLILHVIRLAEAPCVQSTNFYSCSSRMVCLKTNFLHSTALLKNVQTEWKNALGLITNRKTAENRQQELQRGGCSKCSVFYTSNSLCVRV